MVLYLKDIYVVFLLRMDLHAGPSKETMGCIGLMDKLKMKIVNY